MSENNTDQITTNNDSSQPHAQSPLNGKHENNKAQPQKVNLSPEQLQIIVMQSINNVNAKKDELTIAVKQLSDLATQLSKICAQQNDKLKENK